MISEELNSGELLEQKAPKVTVLMSVYNGEDFLSESIQSILNQSFTDFEFLIIDDGSTDESVNIINSFLDKRIRLFQNKENMGLIKSLNKGLELSKGNFIARQDADDIALENRLETQIGFLDDNPEYCLVGSNIELIDAFGNSITEWKYPTFHFLCFWRLFFNSCVAHSSSMFKADLAKSIGGYSLFYKYAEDYYLWSQLIKHERVANIPQTLQKYRVHDGAVSTVKKEQQIAVMKEIGTHNIKEFISQIQDGGELKLDGISSILELHSNKCDTESYFSSLTKLYTLFTNNNALSSEEISLIEESIVEAYLYHLSQLPFQSRFLYAMKASSLLPSKVWSMTLTVKCLISSKIKEAIRSLLGKKPYYVER